MPRGGQEKTGKSVYDGKIRKVSGESNSPEKAERN